MAGVILIEKYKNHFGREDYAVILFYNINKDLYEEPGGHMMENKTVQQTASTELIEETCNLFRINPLYLTHHTSYNNYNSFLLYIKGPKDVYGNHPIFSDYYRHNRDIVHNRNSPHQYKETYNMRRFYISDMINSGLLFNRGEFICVDANGNIRKISGRTKTMLKSFIGRGYITFYNNHVQVNINPLILGFNPNYQSYKKPFLNNTITYFI